MSFRSFRCDPNIDFVFLAVGDVAVFSTGLLMNRYIPRIVCNRVIMIDIYRHMYAVGFPVYLVECVALQPCPS